MTSLTASLVHHHTHIQLHINSVSHSLNPNSKQQYFTKTRTRLALVLTWKPCPHEPACNPLCFRRTERSISRKQLLYCTQRIRRSKCFRTHSLHADDHLKSEICNVDCGNKWLQTPEMFQKRVKLHHTEFREGKLKTLLLRLH